MTYDAVTATTIDGTWPDVGAILADGVYHWVVTSLGDIHASGACRWVRVVAADARYPISAIPAVATCIVEPEHGFLASFLSPE